MEKGLDNADLTNELIYLRYLMNNEQLRQYFRDLKPREYIALHIISAAGEESIYSGRTYLKDLADKMQLPIRQASKIISSLRDRGLVKWAHDGDGTEGTYVIITEAGSRLMDSQEALLKAYYGRVIEKYGKENMIQFLQMMKELETVMSSVLEESEGENNDSGEYE